MTWDMTWGDRAKKLAKKIREFWGPIPPKPLFPLFKKKKAMAEGIADITIEDGVYLTEGWVKGIPNEMLEYRGVYVLELVLKLGLEGKRIRVTVEEV